MLALYGDLNFARGDHSWPLRMPIAGNPMQKSRRANCQGIRAAPSRGDLPEWVFHCTGGEARALQKTRRSTCTHPSRSVGSIPEQLQVSRRVSWNGVGQSGRDGY